MMTQKVHSCLLIMLLGCSVAYSQLEGYQYQRPLLGVQDQWHTIQLPDGLFAKVSNDFSDLRIFGITPGQDTVEAPYILRLGKEEVNEASIDFKLLNQTIQGENHFFTFSVPTRETINSIDLDFEQSNFDWRVQLEGSQDQQSWFTIVEDYRILAISNSLTNYHFTRIRFPATQYRYFRIRIPEQKRPRLRKASLQLLKEEAGNYLNYSPHTITTALDKSNQQSIIQIELKQPVPISSIKIEVKDDFDYYRPIRIEYVVDSFQTDQGWKYRYQTLTTGTLSSLEEPEFRFPSTILQRLRLTITNHDNQPLTTGTVTIKGYVHELVTRFNRPGDYLLVYGNPEARAPRYDISRFVASIPEDLRPLQVGEEQTLTPVAGTASSFLNNRLWLWGVMIVIILVLGWFSLKMMRNQ